MQMPLVERVRKIVLTPIDLGYRLMPFKSMISLQTFRYAVCGGSNAALNLFVFFVGYNFVFRDELIQLAGITVTRYIAAYLLALSFSFPIGFLLNKYIVFPQSNLESKVQLARYAFVTISSIVFDYLLLHLLVGYLHFWATPSQAFIIVILSLYSYFCQTYFTFKTVR